MAKLLPPKNFRAVKWQRTCGNCGHLILNSFLGHVCGRAKKAKYDSPMLFHGKMRNKQHSYVCDRWIKSKETNND